MRRNRLIALISLLCACTLLFSGCSQKITASAPAVTLAPVENKIPAPENDTQQGYAQSVLLYLPSSDGAQLLALPETALFSLARHPAEALCRMLFAHPGGENTLPLGGSVSLSLSGTDPVEVSGQVATVNLSASALRLSHEELFTVGQALANTLCQFGDIAYVNVLIAGVQPGLDIAASLPAGCFQPNTREDLNTLFSRASAPKTAARRAITAALYYPAPQGKGILSEARTLSFAEITPAAMARTLLEALSAGAEYLPGVPRFPDLAALLLSDPSLDESAGMRRLSLHFNADLNHLLLEAGITRSVMVSSLVYTLTTFLPGLDGVEMQIGDEKIAALTPSATYLNAGETIFFQDNLMQRKHFASFLLSHCTLYFSGPNEKLQAVSRPVPFYEACNPRAIIKQLMLGPQPFDSVSGLSPALPEGLRDADLLGVSLHNNTLLLNFSHQLLSLSQGMDSKKEQHMVYALVNTLAELRNVKKVRFFIMGKQPETFAGALFLPGDFLPNPALIHNSTSAF